MEDTPQLSKKLSSGKSEIAAISLDGVQTQNLELKHKCQQSSFLIVLASSSKASSGKWGCGHTVHTILHNVKL